MERDTILPRNGPYFAGWYLKHQTREGRTLALIPAIHRDSRGRTSASLQVVTDREAWWLEYPAEAFRASREGFQVRLGENTFGSSGIRLERPDLRGAIVYGPLAPPRSDIMGPFRHIPGLECVHGVLSMRHGLRGAVTIRGEVWEFDGGMGYLETDRGRSFPKGYLWVQCAWAEGSMMLAVARVPLGLICFDGCVCALCHQGEEHRFATYRGGRAVYWAAGGAVVRQGRYRLEVTLPRQTGHCLRAPVDGGMDRTIRECLGGTVRIRLFRDGTLLLDRRDSHGSFEFVPPEEG